MSFNGQKSKEYIFENIQNNEELFPPLISPVNSRY